VTVSTADDRDVTISVDVDAEDLPDWVDADDRQRIREVLGGLAEKWEAAADEPGDIPPLVSHFNKWAEAQGTDTRVVYDPDAREIAVHPQGFPESEADAEGGLFADE
jgi:hypothetical protein